MTTRHATSIYYQYMCESFIWCVHSWHHEQTLYKWFTHILIKYWCCITCGHGIQCTKCYVKVRPLGPNTKRPNVVNRVVMVLIAQLDGVSRLLSSRDIIVMVFFVRIRDSISYIHFHLLKERKGMALKPWSYAWGVCTHLSGVTLSQWTAWLVLSF